jgi:hypothetical protein
LGNNQKSLTIGQKVVTYARGKLGRFVGPRGECSDLADAALKDAGGQQLADMQTVTEDADYVWGDEIQPKDAAPGDILQFRDFVMTKKTTTLTITKSPNGTTTTSSAWGEETVTRPHHTAIVESNDGDGGLTILEQNIQRPGSKALVKKVFRNTMRWKSSSERPVKNLSQAKGGGSVEVTTTVAYTVEGTIWAYHPKAK